MSIATSLPVGAIAGEAGPDAARHGETTRPPIATMSPRTSRLLEGPIIPVMLSMAFPNVLVMLAQASTGLIETWFVSRLGLDALTGMALVFPGFMMMQMLSAGAIGGGISSPVARARRRPPRRRRRPCPARAPRQP